MILKTTNDDGSRGLHPAVSIMLLTLSMAVFIMLNGWLLFLAENGSEGSIHTVVDGAWTVFMTITTIGFGDFYPVTDYGRLIIIESFIGGAALVSITISSIIEYFRQDGNIPHIQRQLAEVMRKLEMFEACGDYRGSSDHYLDDVLELSEYSSRFVEGTIAMGQDSSGMYVVSVCGNYLVGGKPFSRWIPCLTHEDALRRFAAIKDNVDVI